MAEFLSLTLVSVSPAAQDISLFEFRAAEGEAPLPGFTAGAHLTLLLPSGLQRSYSLCNDPAERDRYLVAVKREEAGRGGSREMHDLMRPGQVLQSRPPANHFPLAPPPVEVLLIGGGIGITPIVAMTYQLLREQRPFRLVLLARSRAEAAFLEQLQTLVAPERLLLHFDDEAQGYCDIAAQIRAAAPDCHLQCCGPAPLMAAVRAAGLAAGWAEDRLHFEHFTNDTAALVASDHAFTLVLARSNREITVAADETALSAVLRAGVDVDYSCAEGSCGTCITRILEGEADHRDAVLMPGERASNIVLCCSRAKGDRLVVDL